MEDKQNEFMKYAMCIVPVGSLRKEPSHKTEMVSQLLFGECCIILQKDTGWIKIRCKYDGYEGWCQQGQVGEVDAETYHLETQKLAAGWVNEIYIDDAKLLIPFGSEVRLEKNKKDQPYSGELWNADTVKITTEIIKQIAFTFLNTAYLWGGKSVFGIDCSGFSQTVYKFLNIPLKRDAHQQAEQGVTVNSLQDAKCGDLAFFDNQEGRITHVGILLEDKKIIHASVKVRIDKIDEDGITNIETGEQTHKLKMIKRFFKNTRIF
ncbi:MAG: C40 family peptidase [Chitinophagaceae bacterium]|nr:C40 family peptidase [Chitinophagaceae bacterium]